MIVAPARPASEPPAWASASVSAASRARSVAWTVASLPVPGGRTTATTWSLKPSLVIRSASGVPVSRARSARPFESVIEPAPAAPTRATVAPAIAVPSTALTMACTVAVPAAAGAAATVTVWVEVAECPPPSTTVRVTTGAPPAANTWAMVAPLPCWPSPKSHAYDSALPSPEVEPVASKTTALIAAAVVAAAIAALGPPATTTGGAAPVLS